MPEFGAALTLAHDDSARAAGNRHEVVVPRGTLGACHGWAITRSGVRFPAADGPSCARIGLPTPRYLTGWRCRGYFPNVKTRFEAIASAGLLAALLAMDAPSFAQSVPNSDQLHAQIAELEKPAGQAANLKQPLDAAKSALNRARDARAAGDVEHGVELEALAFDHITMARDLLRAMALEASLNKAQTDYTATETALRQTEILLETTVAQRERTKAELLQSRAERDAKKAAGSVKPEPKHKEPRHGKGAKK